VRLILQDESLDLSGAMRWSTAVAGGMQIGEGCSSDYGAFDEASSNVAFALDCLQAGPTTIDGHTRSNYDENNIEQLVTRSMALSAMFVCLIV
jgi:hypothetical protein